MRLLLRVLLSLGLTACASSPRFTMEPVDARAELLDELEKVSTDFKVNPGDDSHSWGRALYFFSHHTSDYHLTPDPEDDWSFQLDNFQSAKDALRCSVRKRFYRGDFLYKVICAANPALVQNITSEMAVLNARNLSRFIQGGALEAYLIKGQFPPDRSGARH